MKFTTEQIEYMQTNYANLSEQEKEALRKVVRSPAGQAIGKVMGPDFVSLMGTLALPKRGLAAPRP
jgi:hypothetical protein